VCQCDELFRIANFVKKKKKRKKDKKRGKAILATGRGGPQKCETLRIPHFLYS
jgi:hypothetical protein